MEHEKEALIYITRELSILYQLSKLKSNKYTIKLLDAFVDGNNESQGSFQKLYIVTDFYEASMWELFNATETTLSEYQVKVLIFNLLLSLHFINSAGIIHRDLKASNILINDRCQVTLCDFGLARTISDQKKKRSMSPSCYTRYYRPPEVILQNDYNQKADVWSVGCLASELIQVSLKKQNGQILSDEERVLFKGSSCFPISPIPQDLSNKK